MMDSKHPSMAGTNILLIGEEFEENLALRHLASAAAAAGLIVEIVPLAKAEADPIACLRREPILIGLSMTFQAGLPRFTRVAAALRDIGYKGHVTAGGQFATVIAKRLLEICQHIDSVVRGEGEDALVELVHAVRRGGGLAAVAGLSYRSSSTDRRFSEAGSGHSVIHENPPQRVRDDLDALPRPTRTPPFIRQAGLPLAVMLGSRGCMQKCTYCSIQTFHRQHSGPRQRFRAETDIADEMADLYVRHGVRIFVFHDDNFLFPDPERSLKRARTFRDEIHRRGLHEASLVVKIRPDIVAPDIVEALRDAGLVRAYVGIESGNPRGLKVLGRGCSLEANHAALRTFRDLGVFVCYNLLVFHPETSLEEVREDIAFARAHPEAAFNVGRVEIYAGTPFERWLGRTGRLLGPEFARSYRIPDTRAELASGMMARVFHRRAFHIHGLLNRTASLGYEAAARRRVLGGTRLGALQREVTDFIGEIGENTCDVLMRIVSTAERPLPSPSRLQGLTADLAWEVNRRDLQLEDRLLDLRRRILGAAPELGHVLEGALS